MDKRVLVRVFLRSFFLQASWNPLGMQNLGLAYALFPALEHLYPDPEERAKAVRRHLTFFNTHPYVAAGIVGGVLHHEQKIARGEASPQEVVAFKGALMGPFAALGDGFFWLSLKPAAGAFCAALVPLLGAWAVVLFLFLYNAVHFTFRIHLFILGLREGDRLVQRIALAKLPRRGARLRAVAAACGGGLAAYLALDFGANQGGLSGGMMASGCLALGALSYWLASKRFTSHALLYLAAVLATAAGAFL